MKVSSDFVGDGYDVTEFVHIMCTYAWSTPSRRQARRAAFATRRPGQARVESVRRFQLSHFMRQH